MEKNIDLTRKRILAVDYGQKFTGLATYTPEIDPFVLLHGRIAYESDEKLCLEIKKIIDDEVIEVIVVGVPHLTDGQKTTMTKTVENFIELLRKKISDLPIFEQDETLSSFEAKERMLNSPRFNFQIDMRQIDAVAASIILEEFYENFKRGR